MFDTSKLGERIRANRRRLGMTQGGLSSKLNVSFQSVSSWECGSTMPDIENLCRLSQVFGVTVDELLRSESLGEEFTMIGIDGGGTKCEIVLFTNRGEVKKRVKLSATNATLVGVEKSAEIMAEGIDACLCDGDKLEGIFIGCAGSRLDEIKAILTKKYVGIPLFIDSDGVNAMASGDGDAALICGTGSIMLIRDGDGYKCIGGWGARFGDPGSAYNFGREAIRSAYAYEDGVSDDNVMYCLLTEHLGIQKIRGSGLSEAPVSKIGELASVLFSAYKLGNARAAEVIESEMKDLAYLINAACPNGGRLVACGGIIEHYYDILVPMLQKYVSVSVDFVIPQLPPIYGAAVECCRRMGITKSETFFKEFSESYARQINTSK